jgi:hypothetical protein
MDNDVHRFSQNVRKGQWRPVDPDSMTGRAFSPATAKPSGGSGLDVANILEGTPPCVVQEANRWTLGPVQSA